MHVFMMNYYGFEQVLVFESLTLYKCFVVV